MNTPPPSANNLPMPQWAYVPGEMVEDDADHDTLWKAKSLVPSRFGDYVPARHAIFLSCALGLAEVVGANNIVMGASGRAMGLRPSRHRDCQPAFFQAFQAMAKDGRAIILTRHVVRPAEDEIRSNPPSRSAKLRAIELL